MLAKVLRSFGSVPLKVHTPILSLESANVYLTFRLAWATRETIEAKYFR
jgi:hypothetical protein